MSVPRQIAYLPFDASNRSNAYAFRMRDLLGQQGEVGPFIGTRRFVLDVLRLRASRVDLLVLNWLDSELLDPASHRLLLRRALRLCARIVAMRCAARHVVFVRHNHYPHATLPHETARARRWVDRLERLCCTAVTHSPAAATADRRYVPHPLYRHGPLQRQAVADWDLPDDYFVMFGAIAPYKRLAEVIAAFPAQRQLVIAGAVGDEAYARALAALQRPNMRLRAGFVDDAQGQALVAGATALLIAHADADVIVSGSFFFAASVGTPVIAVQTPFLLDAHASFGAAVVTPVPDIAALCQAAAGFERGARRGEVDARIEQAYGDAAVLAAWAPIVAGDV